MNDNVDVQQGTSPPTLENVLFGKYEFGRLLGRGSFAKVYLARDINSRQNVAIKIINKNKIVSTALMSNIKREISIMRRLRHPNIVMLFEVLATKSKIYFVMEFVKGGELFAKISKGKFTEDLSRKYFHQLISAVGYCHSHGVYHRDLKPENLLIGENGDLKVSDFGLSAVTGQIHNDGLLHTLCGTPAYVAPEVLSKKGYDGVKVVDIWSCGVILFVLTAGFLPFNDSNMMVMYRKIYKGDFRCPKWMSSDLKNLVFRLLETNPSKRISINEIIRHPWFAKDFTEIKFDEEDPDLAKFSEEEVSTLNAFDIISFSSGLNLAGLFNDESVNGDEMLVVEESPERVIEKVHEVAKDETVRLKRKRDQWGVDMEGQNGDFAMGLEVYRLTDNLAVVEVKRKNGDDGVYNDLWTKKFKPEILGGRREDHVSVE
ncbi:hypothetical protein LguiB_030997 [Lonicera macranthoides]